MRDDGARFGPRQLLFESGIATMRTFAARGDGVVTLSSRPGHGTTVDVQLGTVVDGPSRPRVAGHGLEAPEAGAAQVAAPRLRLLTGGLTVLDPSEQHRGERVELDLPV